MKKTIIQALKFLGFLALGVLLLFFAFRGIAVDELADTLRGARWGWIGLSLLFALISFFLRARRWVLLVEPLGYKPSYFNTYHALMIGYLSNYALPRLGEVTRCVTLGRREKIPVDSLIGTVIVERVIDLVMLFLILLALMVSWVEKFGGFFGELVYAPIRQKAIDTFGGAWLLWVIIAATLLLLLGVLYMLRSRLTHFLVYRKTREIILGILKGLKTIYTMKGKWEFILHSLLIWFFYILMTWMVVFALEETAGLTFIDGMFLLVAGGLGMSAPVTAGFGAYHWITSRGLMFVYDLPLEVGGAYAILAHESNSLLTILLGIISYLTLTMTRRKQTLMTA